MSRGCAHGVQAQSGAASARGATWCGDPLTV